MNLIQMCKEVQIEICWKILNQALRKVTSMINQMMRTFEKITMPEDVLKT